MKIRFLKLNDEGEMMATELKDPMEFDVTFYASKSHKFKRETIKRIIQSALADSNLNDFDVYLVVHK